MEQTQSKQGGGNDVLLRYSDTDSILIRNFDLYGVNGTATPIEAYQFADGSSITVNAGENYDGAGSYGIDKYDAEGALIDTAFAETLQGDGGNDHIYSEHMDDYLQFTTDVAIAKGNSDTGSGNFGDILIGNAGDDTLFGGLNNDALMGGTGNDLIIAGAGDDHIYGDREMDGAPPQDFYMYFHRYSTLQWMKNDNGVWGVGQWHSSIPNIPSPPAPICDPAGSGNDTLYAGNGNDSIEGGGGNDVAYGEAGDDHIFGDFGQGDALDAGNDYLKGGDGNERMRWREAANDAEERMQA